ncbi:hypothetical protein AAZX31_11G250300 [Glycine max]|uniref:Uncharacterized protein n=2 Tax=Glycine subgen. Soja TaxID=1462606 RepID=K7LS27_SOYBN|nr:midasin [Glycine max]XP_028195606.1 midasin-like [Glycine soja]KAG4995546.1 hypothetical protein JHK86_032373 [Glycine max]KAH1160672.1 hypothetical protein GYH30_032116 [Glycine max]KHN44390.1 hypothetical protein glysoja_014431 [Glycine soja]KRH31382.1 hypothetical protein GLYMA_11G245500v4 [Glycine max]RZB73254.1 hypothetical protein D0Y65_037119 [Glycine soja]|eukprot:XP_003537551.1 midasin [Glycine max]
MATSTPKTNVVFIDTNLDTHLALVVSDLDTVSNLKKSILSEHPLCFPKIGKIQIHGIKVERKGYFYHLTDSMPVRSAFSGVKESWFLTVDVSVLRECAQNDQLFSLGIANNALTVGSPSKRGCTFDNFKLPQLDNRPVENEEIPVASPHVLKHTGKGVKSSGHHDTGTPLPGSIPETEDHCFVNRKLPSLNTECEVDGSGKGIKDDRNVCEEAPVSSAKKIRKSNRKKQDMVQDDNSKDAAAVDNALSFPSKRASSANNELPGSRIECEVDGTNEGIKDACIVHEEGNCKSVSSVKKKQKGKRKKEDAVQHDTSKVNDSSVVGSGDYTIQQDIQVVANPSEDADKEVIKETEILKEHQHADGSNNNTKNDIDVAASANKKHKKRKRSLTVDSKEMFKVETAIQKDEMHKSDEAHKERKESKEQFELKNEKSRDDVEYKQDQVTEDILNTGPPAKKKRNGKEKSGEESLSKANLINDFNVDSTSHHILEDQQKIKNSNADQSAEHFDDTNPPRTSVRGRRKKGKINSSNPYETPVVTSSRKDEEADCSSIQRGVQKEISEDGLSSKDLGMSKATINNMETGTDACKEGFQSTERTTANYKNHSDIGIKAHTADVDEPMELTENNENVVLDQCHKNEADQIEGAEEGREVSPHNDPKLVQLEKSTSSSQDKTDANIGELNVTSKGVDVNGMTEPIKSVKEKRTRKAKNSGGGSALREGIGLVDASEHETVIMKSLSAKNCDPKSGNTETEENPLNQTEGGKNQQEKVQGTSDKEDDSGVDNADSLEQIKTKSNAEHMDKRQRKKSNSKQTSTSKSISSMLTKDQVLDSKKPSPSSGSGTHGKPSVAVTKKSKSTSTKSTNKSSKTNLELVEDSVRLELSDSRFNSGGKDAAQHSTCSPGEKDDDNLEAINGHTHAEDLSSSQQLSSKEKLDVRSDLGKKVPNVHRTGQDSKLSGRSDRAVSLIGENRKAHVNAFGKSMDLEKQRKRAPVSNLKLEGSIKMVQNKAGKASGNNVRGVASKTQQEKSLLSGAIFKDDSSSTSEDEVDNSDASTRTPSYNPLMSDFSDGDSSSVSYGGRSQENGARSSVKASFSGTKGMSIDDVLRSSSRFKKARTASLLEETQSQPEFVPDSLAE